MVHFGNAVTEGLPCVSCGWEITRAFLGRRRSNMIRIHSKDLAAGRYFRHGNSYGVLIPVHIREQIGWVVNDTVLMAYEHGILWIAKPDRNLIMSREKVAAILDKLFPDEASKRERT